ncbi:MAG: hypothetical protein KatS3mg104_2602 [Phycisphaerae bacterium]|jgi:hypothetical protein|nr:MAG: hypothetical protein KatS3mg104_2602 [Phycisphaerae bacterium]
MNPIPILLVFLVLQTEPTSTPVESLEQLRNEHRKLVEQEFSSLPTIPPAPIQKLIGLSLEELDLRVQPLIDPTNGAVSVQTTNWPGLTQITVGSPQRLMVHLKHVDLSRPGQIATYTQIITGPDYLQISRDSESPDGLSSVSLIQSRQFADDAGDPVRLNVRQIRDDERSSEVSMQLSASSFVELKRQHPREVQKYLLPIFKDLQASSLLRSSDPAMAWQVLSVEIEIDPVVRREVLESLKQLDSPDFSRRALAEDRLVAMGPQAAVVLSRIDSSELGPDPQATVDSILRSHFFLPREKIEALRNDIDFLCDTLLLDEPVLRAAAMSRIGDLTGKTIDLPDSLSPEQREARVAGFKAQLLLSTLPSSSESSSGSH